MAAEEKSGGGPDSSSSSAVGAPEFLSAVPNVTVAVGRDAILRCEVKNLQDYKARKRERKSSYKNAAKASLHEPTTDLSCGCIKLMVLFSEVFTQEPLSLEFFKTHL